MMYRCSQGGNPTPSGGVDRLCGDGVIRRVPYPPEYILLTAEQLPGDRAGWIIQEAQDGHDYGTVAESETETATPKRRSK